MRSQLESEVLDSEIIKLLEKDVVSKTDIDSKDFFSNLFTKRKKDSSFRMILNLKFLNIECNTNHFKMESIKHAINMISPGDYLASIDIKDAFYTIPIHPDYKHFLKFMWRGIPYQFEAMPNGYLDVMRVFTKILKPPFSALREKRFLLSSLC